MKLVLALVALAALAFVPSFAGPYPLGLMIGILGYGVLATAWAMFSGPTRYISLATVAFFGLGAYTVAVLSETLPYPVVLLVAAFIGLVVALIVGLATLRLAGIYFVIFTFGLTELVRQLAATLAIAFWVRQSRIGLALRVIGDDPVVASHLGIRITRTKLTLFSISCVIMTLAGAIQAPRWTYIEPSIVFNPTTSFLVVIMALLGGPNRLFGPLLGAIPLFLLFEWLSANFPNHYSIILGLLFIAIVFVLPNGVLAAGESLWARMTRKEARA
jgi:branched-chain amino acid transport system permease protein